MVKELPQSERSLADLVIYWRSALITPSDIANNLPKKWTKELAEAFFEATYMPELIPEEFRHQSMFDEVNRMDAALAAEYSPLQ